METEYYILGGIPTRNWIQDYFKGDFHYWILGKTSHFVTYLISHFKNPVGEMEMRMQVLGEHSIGAQPWQRSAPFELVV